MKKLTNLGAHLAGVLVCHTATGEYKVSTWRISKVSKASTTSGAPVGSIASLLQLGVWGGGRCEPPNGVQMRSLGKFNVFCLLW